MVVFAVPLAIAVSSAAGGALLTWYAGKKLGEPGQGWAMYGKPIGLMIIGGAIAYTSTLVPKQMKYIKAVPLIAGIATIGYGAIQLFNTAQTLGGRPANKDDKFTVMIERPPEGEVWSQFVGIFLKQIEAKIVNQQDEGINVYVGMSLLDPSENWLDFPVIEIAVPARGAVNVPAMGTVWWGKWDIHEKGLWLEGGDWMARVGVWDKFPAGDCEAQGICHRLGQDEVHFRLTPTGV